MKELTDAEKLTIFEELEAQWGGEPIGMSLTKRDPDDEELTEAQSNAQVVGYIMEDLGFKDVFGSEAAAMAREYNAWIAKPKPKAKLAPAPKPEKRGRHPRGDRGLPEQPVDNTTEEFKHCKAPFLHLAVSNHRRVVVHKTGEVLIPRSRQFWVTEQSGKKRPHRALYIRTTDNAGRTRDTELEFLFINAWGAESPRRKRKSKTKKEKPVDGTWGRYSKLNINAVRELRAAGKSTRQIATELGVSQSAVSRCLSGDRKEPGSNQVWRVSETAESVS